MVSGLSVSDVVNVTVTVSPTAAGTRDFGALLIAGPTAVIDTTQRIREYSSLEGVGEDFSITDPEWLAADLFFSQSPQPSQLFIGRWASAATKAVLHGAILTAAQQASLLAALQIITTGSMAITVDGTLRTLTGLDFHLITTLNGAASVIQTALAAVSTGATVTWAPDSNDRFNILSGTTGTGSTITYATTAGSGVDVSASLKLTAATGAPAPVNGIAVETPAAAAAILLGSGLDNNDVYGLMFAPTASTDITDVQHEAVAALIEGLQRTHVYGITIQNTNVIDGSVTNDLGSALQDLGYKRTFTQYSSSSGYAVASIFGRAFTVDFSAQNSTITLKFKQEPGVVAESLTENQAAALNDKNVNVFVNYDNNTAIVQQGVMANGYFFDEVHGLDWLQNEVQTEVYNELYQSPTKIPQTDAGVNKLVIATQRALNRGVNNGLIAPGVWNSSLEFGKLKEGDVLATGFYVYAPPVSSQAQSVREQRIAPTLQTAIKLAGAIHFANVAINVNR